MTAKIALFIVYNTASILTLIILTYYSYRKHIYYRWVPRYDFVIFTIFILFMNIFIINMGNHAPGNARLENIYAQPVYIVEKYKADV